MKTPQTKQPKSLKIHKKGSKCKMRSYYSTKFTDNWKEVNCATCLNDLKPKEDY